MKNMKAKLAALEAMTERGMGDDAGTVPAHDVTCPNCGHEWTMGGKESENSDDEEAY
jgi:hypothetical protein